jgi:hypothetical protein
MKISPSFLLGALLLFNVGFVIAQEAVTEKPASQSQETMTEEAAPTPAPAERPKKKASHKKSSGGALRDLMTQEEFEAMGLDKLTPSELEHLSWWMQGYRRGAGAGAAPRVAAASAAAPTAQAPAETATAAAETKTKVRYPFLGKKQAIYSRVDGVLGPLTGHTIVALEDGTKWKQANADDRFRPRTTDHPPAAVLPTSFGWKMRIEGMPDFYVNPVSE